ncbi:hypothetical protein C8Q72DRAFT_632224 [Fomitopsis betulina]|nr:hypothetical protein C8Q72DRAFT_632224 [Fomitopsis betulina]
MIHFVHCVGTVWFVCLAQCALRNAARSLPRHKYPTTGTTVCSSKTRSSVLYERKVSSCLTFNAMLAQEGGVISLALARGRRRATRCAKRAV